MAETIGGERVIVSFACNDPDNGSPLGRASACEIDDLELVNTFMGGGNVKVWHQGEVLHVGRCSVGFLWSKGWYGNWCWDAYGVPMGSATAIVNYLMKLKWWRCESGECNAVDKFNAKQPLTIEEMSQAVGRR